MSRQLVHYHIERMEDCGLVSIDRDGNVPVISLGATLQHYA